MKKSSHISNICNIFIIIPSHLSSNHKQSLALYVTVIKIMMYSHWSRSKDTQGWYTASQDTSSWRRAARGSPWCSHRVCGSRAGGTFSLAEHFSKLLQTDVLTNKGTQYSHCSRSKGTQGRYTACLDTSSLRRAARGSPWCSQRVCLIASSH